MKTREMILNKITSGRFWLVILFGITICYLAKVEPSIRDAFMALAGGVIRDYFGRSDRGAENGKPKDEVKP